MQKQGWSAYDRGRIGEDLCVVQLTLPKNSKIGKGRHFPAAAGAKKVQTFRIYRYDPEVDANPRWDTYDVDVSACENGWNIVSTARGEIPIPVSETENLRRVLAAPGTTRAETVTLPA